ncbi:helix-turn-helix domain-containing protein [Brachybacterium fresconis]|uniref:Excisionase family DNA binding protein n=1 Tax=Brachybacterium fresconis TaxID=173363 RepID=A0ABS4YJ26_9MICO|nr:helix-turn-helix domain-containing protein [Brachybacterium fresconis]MBP2408804.1 excisionase family DNA binding protein [Brachybacterium fresconis]
MSSTPPVSPIYVTLQQAVAEGYAAYSTLRGYIADGRLPAIYIGGRIKIRREDLDALATPARQAPTRDVVAAVERIVAEAPPLTPEQREHLAVILGGTS